jgi:hypothetical protein
VSTKVEEAPKIPTAAVAPRMEPAMPAPAKKGDGDNSTDFKEDPFSNYRYEDPFMIEDPFQDEQEAPAAVFKGKSLTHPSVLL